MHLRKRITTEEKVKTLANTGGYCHFCGEKLYLHAKRGEKGRWNVDHAVQLAQGGKDDISNYLPICRTCNRLRWSFPSSKIRELFRLGIIAFREIKKNTNIGKDISLIYKKQLDDNKKRRKGSLEDEYYS